MIQDCMGRWTIPKGHVEPGESIEQTAVREVSEETGLMNLRLGDKLEKIFFFHRKEGKLVFTTTHVFLIKAVGDTDELRPGDSEGIIDTRWFDSEEALTQVAYRDTEKVFRMALDKLGVKRLEPAGDQAVALISKKPQTRRFGSGYRGKKGTQK
jgi:8-oxo-dGTP pyrophosphatase MutT (NUDIX family)